MSDLYNKGEEKRLFAQWKWVYTKYIKSYNAAKPKPQDKQTKLC